MKDKSTLISSFDCDKTLRRTVEASKKPILKELNKVLIRHKGELVLPHYDQPVIDFVTDDGCEQSLVPCKIHSLRLENGAALAVIRQQWEGEPQETFLRDEPVETLLSLLRCLLWRDVDPCTIDLPF